MYIKMRRVFHPVGQGAFYSESFYTGFGTFNMVYDCGSMSKGVDNIISNSFDKDNGNDIDILFISHFDSDHVNKIALLKKSVNKIKKKIKKVIMPLIPDEDKGILLAFNIASNREYQDCANIIINPQAFFGDGTRIIQVRERESLRESSGDNPEEAQATININEVETPEIDSGTNIHFHDPNIFITPFWVYKPYNYKHKGRNRELIDKFNSKNISIGKLLDVEYINKNIKEIRACYQEIEGDINQNSLVLYSNHLGIDSRCDTVCHKHGRWYYYMWINSPGCIYTGDVNLAKIRRDFKNSITRYRGYRPVGTIQVPHHGSKNGFDIGFFDDFNGSKYGIISPFSFGLSNPYGHPSCMVIKKLLKDHFPVLVTNDEKSFIQHFVF